MTCDIHVTTRPRNERSVRPTTDASNRSQERPTGSRTPERPAWRLEEAEYFIASDDESASTVSSARRPRHVRQRRHTTAGDDAADTIFLDSSGRPLTARDAETIHARENGRARSYTSGQDHSTDVGSETRSGEPDSDDASPHRRLRFAARRHQPSARFASQMRSLSVSPGSALTEGDPASSLPDSEGGDLASPRRPFHARPRVGRHGTGRNRTFRLPRSLGEATGQQPRSSSPTSASLDSAGTRISFARTFGRERNSSGTSSVGAPMPLSAGLRYPPGWRPDTPSSRSCSDGSASNTPSQSDSVQRDGPYRPPR